MPSFLAAGVLLAFAAAPVTVAVVLVSADLEAVCFFTRQELADTEIIKIVVKNEERAFKQTDI